MTIRKNDQGTTARVKPPQWFIKANSLLKKILLLWNIVGHLADGRCYCLNRNLKNRSVDASSSVRRLAAITGISLTIKPYTSHMATPRQKRENIPKDRSLAERLFQVFTTCGRKAAVVKEPANKPNN